MSEPRKKSDWSIVASIVLVMILLAPIAYVVGYFSMSSFSRAAGVSSADRPFYLRTFDYDWQAVIYRPAAQIESRICGKVIIATSRPTIERVLGPNNVPP